MEHPPHDTCLMFASGIYALDRSDIDNLEVEHNLPSILTVARLADGDGYSLRLFHEPDIASDRVDNVVPLPKAYTPAEVAAAAQAYGVRWIAPTVHASHTVELARIAEQAGLTYPSSVVVEAVENKATFYDVLSAAGQPVPLTFHCVNRASITHAMESMRGKRFFLKANDGAFSGKSQRLVDCRQGVPSDAEIIVDEHLQERDAAGFNSTLVQEYVGDTEYGFEAMIEATPEGPRLAWAMTTRKETRPVYGRWISHIYDPADEERLWYTNELILPAMQTIVNALDEVNQRATNGRGLPNCVINADFRTGGKSAWCIDASFRWAPRFKQIANASVGRVCHATHFPRLANPR